MGLGPSHDVPSAHGTRLPCKLTSAREYGKRRDAPNIEACSQVGHRFSIHFGQPHVGFKLGGGLFESWRHRAARAAPRGPKIYQNRNLIATNMFVERCLVQRYRVGIE